MLIHLYAPSFDLSGSITLDVLPTSDFGETRRRMNRIATLDGAAVFNDFGSTEADRTIRLEWKPGTQEPAVARLVRLYQRLILSCHEGVFNVAPESYKSTSTGSTLTLLVAEKLTT